MSVRYVALLAVILLAGCERTWNSSNIREFKRCTEAGMEPVNNIGGGITCRAPAVKP